MEIGFNEREIKVVEEAVKAFERLGIKVYIDFTGKSFHIIIPVSEISKYFERSVANVKTLKVEAQEIIANRQAYIDIRITKP